MFWPLTVGWTVGARNEQGRKNKTYLTLHLWLSLRGKNAGKILHCR